MRPCGLQLKNRWLGLLSGVGTWFLLCTLVQAQQIVPQASSALMIDPPGDAAAVSAGSSTTAVVALPPEPQPAASHAFWDRKNIQLFSATALLRGLDYASTRNFQARGREEILLPQDVVNNSAGFASLEAAATVTSVGIAYWLHRTGHHKLERWISIGHASVTAFGDARNYALKTSRRQ